MNTENELVYASRHDLEGKVGEVVVERYGGKKAYIGNDKVIFVAYRNNIYKGVFGNDPLSLVTPMTTFTLDSQEEVDMFNRLQEYVRANGKPYHETIILEREDKRYKDNEGGVLLDEQLGWSFGADLDGEVCELYSNLRAIEELEAKGAVDTRFASNSEAINFSVGSSEAELRAEYRRQRLERGFDDTEVWNLDYTFAKFVLPRLKRFKEVNQGYPATMTYEEWDECLDRMIYAFENIDYDDKSYDGIEWFNMPQEARDAVVEKVNEGLDLFRRHYFSLWW